MSTDIKCKLQEKIESGEPLSEEDYRKLSEIVKEVLSFMAKERIIPSPQNYERWFRIFCYARENKLSLSKSELIDIYFDLYNVRVDKREAESANLVERIASELYNEIQSVLKSVSEHQKSITEGGSKLEELTHSVESKDIKRLLNRIMQEVKGLKSVNRKFMEKLEEQSNEIQKLKEELRRAKEEASIDPLTGLRNRRSFERALSEFFRDYKKFGYPFSVIVIDLDDFKRINDTYGHLAGDKVLKELGNILRNYLRAKDVPARTGGEEFTIILPGITKKEALSVAERLRKVLENYTVEYENVKINPTASFGVAEVTPEDDTPYEMIRRADENLYKAKRAGKNRVVG